MNELYLETEANGVALESMINTSIVGLMDYSTMTRLTAGSTGYFVHGCVNLN